MKRKALGKGLSSIIPDRPAELTPPPPAEVQPKKDEDGLIQIDMDRVAPNRGQPRQDFDPSALEELAASIKREGVLQPVIVRPPNNGLYELVAGERRWRAAQMAGLFRIPALVRDVADERMLELALIENLQREELNPIEEANAYQALIDDLGLSQEEIALRVGKQRSTITNQLRLLNLPEPIQARVRRGEIAPGHAKALAGLTDRRRQLDLCERIVSDGLSVRQVESLVRRRSTGGGVAPPKQRDRDPNVVAAEEKLQSALRTKVRIVAGRKGGRLEIQYFSDEELRRIYDLIVDAASHPATASNSG